MSERTVVHHTEKMTTSARRAVLGLIIALSVVTLALVGKQIQLSGDIRREQAKRTALIQQLCENLSMSRVASNEQIRQPLRDALDGLAALLKVAQMNAETPEGRRIARRAAREFTDAANRVTIVGPFQCAFDDEFGEPGPSTSPRPSPSLSFGAIGATPSARRTPSLSPSTVRTVWLAGPTVTVHETATVRVTVTETICRLPNGNRCQPTTAASPPPLGPTAGGAAAGAAFGAGLFLLRRTRKR